ncbi:MAG: Flp pilus assembly complex ATPase component TadA [Phycisphaeraceae bacterium]|nr:Flp pilus assembly complex ATPase component TadA [Phycisphaeraceae bacterium]
MSGFELAIFDPNGSLSQRLRLGAKAITIGRHPDNDVPIKDELASRFHCTVEPDGKGGYRARDLGSRNGTRVNDQPAEDRTLKQGDRIQIGRHVFVMESAGGLDSSSMDETHTPALRESAREAVRPAKAARERERAASEGVVATETESGSGDDVLLRPGMLPAWAKDLVKLIETLTGNTNAMERVAIIDARGKGSDALKTETGGSLAVRLILQAVSKSRATDVHIEPKGDSSSVRFRVDGQMVNIAALPPQIGELATGVVKAACHMKTAGRDAVHDGHFAARFPDRRVDYRASLTPSVHGQKLVLRVLDTRDTPRSLDDLGIPPYMLERVKRVCRQDSGLLLACGPTGSGKTTTLYNALREIDRDRRNVITIEDPVEYQLDKVTQIPLDMGKGATFGSILRSVLRQDPDVILVGEIRDEETARVAMQASMTGHVVFSTVHSKDTIGAVFRLIDLGLEPYLVANALDLVVAQRLVRVLCDHCKRPVRVTPGQSTRIGKYLEGKNEIFSATGCAKCLRTGYRGRRAIFEVLEVSDELRDIILTKPTIADIKRIIEQGHFTTLTQSGWVLVARGATTLEEVDRVSAAS